MEYEALLSGDREAVVPTDGTYGDLVSRIRELLAGRGVRRPYMLTLNGRFLDATTAADLQDGDRIKALPLMGGG